MRNEEISKYLEMAIGILGIIVTLIALFVSEEFRKSKLKWIAIVISAVIGYGIILKGDVDDSIAYDDKIERDKEKELERKERLSQRYTDSLFFSKKFDALLEQQGYTRDSKTNKITVINQVVQPPDLSLNASKRVKLRSEIDSLLVILKKDKTTPIKINANCEGANTYKLLYEAKDFLIQNGYNVKFLTSNFTVNGQTDFLIVNPAFGRKTVNKKSVVDSTNLLHLSVNVRCID